MTTSGGVLAAYVTVRDPKGFGLVTFGPGDTPPEWATRLIKHPSAWASAPAAPVETPEVPEAPETPEVPAAEEDLIGAPAETPSPAPEDSTPPASPDPAPAAPEKPSQAPPEGGAGATRKAWAAFADAWGVQYEAEDGRDEIIAAVKATPGVPS